MQLDQTRIAIRERGLWELMDLALRTSFMYARPLLGCTATLAVPLAVFNWWATHWLVADEYSFVTIQRHVWIMAELIFLQSPIATMATTLFLGRVMFLAEVTPRSLFRELLAFLPRIAWSQLVVRGGAGAFILAFVVSTDATVTATDIVLPMLCLYNVILRSARPYINEIILLEENPLRAGKTNAMTVAKRSHALHAPNSGDLVLRWMLLAIGCLILGVSVAAAFWFVAGAITGQWSWRAMMVEVLIPLTMWLIVIYATVARFLMYLDLRIRREGWEVELKVRSAAHELRGQTA